MNHREAQHVIEALHHGVSQLIVGQQTVIHQVVTAVVADGHVMLEGAPGLAKTTLVRTLARLLAVSFSRIQCTPDLMPSDVTGTMVLADDQPGRYQLVFAPGPIFASLVLVDEINRATPRTQSALLEAMQERTVTVAGTTHPLPEPFLVLATQNPIEMEGTYLLPEAQRDRFLYQVLVDYPSTADLVEIARREATAATPTVTPVCDAATLAQLRTVVRHTLVAEPVLQYAATIIQRTHATTADCPAHVREYVQYGASPRAVQALVRTAQVEALRAGRLQVDFADIQAVALPVLRHRLVLRREARIANMTADTVIQQVLATTTAM